MSAIDTIHVELDDIYTVRKMGRAVWDGDKPACKVQSDSVLALMEVVAGYIEALEQRVTQLEDHAVTLAARVDDLEGAFDVVAV
jgi:hypothetical protein